MKSLKRRELVSVYKIDMRFPRDLPRFLYWIYFKPFSLYEKICQIDPTIANVSHMLARAHARPGRAFRMLALFYILIAPWILVGVTGAGLSLSGVEVNWLRLAFLLVMALALSLSFSVPFCIALLLPFSVTAAIWNSLGMSSALGVFFSLNLGLAYGLTAGSGRWGLTAGFVYGAVFSLILGPLHGLAIGAAFLTGYFRMVFYMLEAPLSWMLGRLAQGGDALRLWQFHPVRWDELIWFPLPGLDKHLVALKKQNGPMAQEAILHVQGSFRQTWAAERIAEKESYNGRVANKDLKGE